MLNVQLLIIPKFYLKFFIKIKQEKINIKINLIQIYNNNQCLSNNKIFWFQLIK
jgi:hypothetical protein